MIYNVSHLLAVSTVGSLTLGTWLIYLLNWAKQIRMLVFLIAIPWLAQALNWDARGLRTWRQICRDFLWIGSRACEGEVVITHDKRFNHCLMYILHILHICMWHCYALLVWLWRTITEKRPANWIPVSIAKSILLIQQSLSPTHIIQLKRRPYGVVSLYFYIQRVLYWRRTWLVLSDSRNNESSRIKI